MSPELGVDPGDGLRRPPAIGAPANAVLYGRERERDMIDALVQAEGGPRTLVLVGEPGTGRTALLRYGLEVAEAAGVLVLHASPSEAERSFGLSALRELVAPVAATVLPRLAVPQREALAVLLRRERAAEWTQALPVAILSTLSALASQSMLLLALDDLQWLDPSSARTLAFALRRLPTSRARVLATRATDGDAPGPFAQALSERRPVELKLEPLEDEAIAALIEARAPASLPAERVRQLVAKAGGNALLAAELAQAPDAAGTEEAEAASVPELLRRVLLARLGALDDAARRALLVTYAVWEPTPVVVERALGLTGEVDGLVGALAAGSLVESRGRLELGHPLLGSVLYSTLGDSERRGLHDRLIEVARSEEERAWQWAQSFSGPDGQMAAALEDAALEARLRGALDSAIHLGRLALTRTPETELEATARRSVRLGVDEFLTGEEEQARARWAEVAATGPTGAIRAEALLRLLEHGGEGTPAEITSRTAQALGHLEPGRRDHDGLAAEIHVAAADRLLWRGQLVAAREHLHEGVRLAERSRALACRAFALALLGTADYYAGSDPTPALQAAVRLERVLPPLPIERSPAMLEAMLLGWQGDHRVARRRLESLLATATARGEEAALPVLHLVLAEFASVAGDVPAIRAHALAANHIVELIGATVRRGWVAHARALAALSAGEIDKAAALATSALEFDEPHQLFEVTSRARGMLGFIELERGRAEQACAVLEPLVAELRRLGHHGAHALRSLPLLSVAEARLGRLDAAHSHAAEFAEIAAGLPWAEPAALRCDAALAAIEGDVVRAFRGLRDAAQRFEEGGFALEVAMTELSSGRFALGRGDRALAQGALRSAEGRFERLGAPGWAGIAREALAGAGGTG